MNGDKLLKMIEDNIDNIFDEEKYKQFMQSIGRFHNYSFSNQLLIIIQKPDAFKVAGYHTWKNKFGRQVKRGEKGIGILAPKIVNYYVVKADNRVLKSNEMTKDELKKAIAAGLVERRRGNRGFLGVTVFDVSQTEGRELDVSVTGLKGAYKDIDKLYKSIEKATGASIVRTKEMWELGVMGYFEINNNRIVVRDLEDVQVAKTALHEASHSLAKRFKEDGSVYEGDYKGWEKDGTKMMKLQKDDEEVIVESASYIIMNELGMDTSEYSFNYIMNWATAYRSTNEGKQRLQLLLGYISKIVDKLLSAIEAEFGIISDKPEEENNDTIKEELADELLSMMEANAVRLKAMGGVS